MDNGWIKMDTVQFKDIKKTEQLTEQLNFIVMTDL